MARLTAAKIISVYENPFNNGELRKAIAREIKNPVNSHPPKEKFLVADK